MRTLFLTLAVLALPMTAACNQKSETEKVADASRQASASGGKLAEQLDRSGDHATIARSLATTGIGGIFAGKDSYTLLAPSDAAFTAMGSRGKALADESEKAALAALLRDHIVPGYVTTSDIEAAIKRSKDGKVTMRTMGEGSIAFSREGDAIVIKAGDGSTARITGKPLLAGASAALPIDGMLKKA